MNTRPPVAHVSGHKRPAIAISCSPKYYALRKVFQTVNMAEKDVLVSPSREEINSVVSGLVLDSDLDSVSDATSNPIFNGSLDLSVDDSVSNAAMDGTSSVTLSDINPNTPSSTFSLLYRMIYAVATQDTVILYDTQQATPLSVLTNLHYATLTDLAW